MQNIRNLILNSLVNGKSEMPCRIKSMLIYFVNPLAGKHGKWLLRMPNKVLRQSSVGWDLSWFQLIVEQTIKKYKQANK